MRVEMYVLGISGSPRGLESTTLQLVRCVLEGASAAGADVELVDITQVRIDYCVVCGSCHATGKCTRQDEFDGVREKMLLADGIVLGSPLYFDCVSAQLKTAIDRLSDVIHCQLFLGKYGCSVCSSGSPDYKIGTDYMNSILTRFGCNVVGCVGAAPAVPGSLQAAQEEALRLGEELVAAIREKRQYPEQDIVHNQMRERFARLVLANKDHWQYEYEYWKSRGWLD
ncbi:MAG: flavodoxin family protein [Armatimonadota bacterium]